MPVKQAKSTAHCEEKNGKEKLGTKVSGFRFVSLRKETRKRVVLMMMVDMAERQLTDNVRVYALSM